MAFYLSAFKEKDPSQLVWLLTTRKNLKSRYTTLSITTPQLFNFQARKLVKSKRNSYTSKRDDIWCY